MLDRFYRIIAVRLTSTKTGSEGVAAKFQTLDGALSKINVKTVFANGLTRLVSPNNKQLQHDTYVTQELSDNITLSVLKLQEVLVTGDLNVAAPYRSSIVMQSAQV